MDIERLERAGRVVRFHDCAAAWRYNDLRLIKPSFVLMGDDGTYWVPAYPSLAERLVRGGYEVAPRP
jgi:hypothetical protein